MQAATAAVLAASWLLWFRAFAVASRRSEPAQEVDQRWRWGVRVVGIAFFLVFLGFRWPTPITVWRIAGSACLLAAAIVLSSTATRALGRYWRVAAGLSAEHELVTWGPYRVVRHPIYTSMLCMLCGTGLLITPWPLLLAAIVVFFSGTGIRVRAEERLLESRFGDQFRQYRRTVPAYIPFLR
jgi:protein-S-isoprenylcysteine O-methyltransferase Ste14